MTMKGPLATHFFGLLWILLNLISQSQVKSVGDTECPEPWPTPRTAVGSESCSCQVSC